MFPKHFFIGASTAAHQVEGNNIHSDYWAMEQMENTMFVEPSGDAVDHYHRYADDIKMLADAGLNAYRFSIEWARIEPEQGVYDQEAIAHYHDVIRCCHENGVEPIVTLHHFTSPKWVICKGGWNNEAVVDWFASYASFAAKEYGDSIRYVCTINEANMRLQLKALMERFTKQMQAAAQKAGSMEGQVQVGLNLNNSMERMKRNAMENLKVFGTPQPANFISGAGENGDAIVIKAHQAAKAAIKAVHPEIKVGITLSLHDLQSIPGGEDKAQAEWDEEFAHYVPYLRDDDFFGLQNYTRTVYGPDGIVPAPKDAPMTQMDYEDYPQALEHVIRRVHQELPGMDILITENGIGIDDDTRRVAFIQAALEGVSHCLADGIPVIGYCHWSLMDNFEWQKGYAMTFGLCAVDRTTQKRMPKPSLSYLGSYRMR